MGRHDSHHYVSGPRTVEADIRLVLSSEDDFAKVRMGMELMSPDSAQHWFPKPAMPFVRGDMVKCISSEGAHSLKEGKQYKVHSWNSSGKLVLERFKNIGFDHTRFEKIKGLGELETPSVIMYGGASGGGKTSFLTELKKRVAEKASDDELYVHGKNNNPPMGLKTRRQRTGKRFTP